MKNRTYNKKKMLVVFCAACIIIFGLIARLVYLMIFDAGYYQKKAEALHEREREIKAARGEIVDRNGNVLATLPDILLFHCVLFPAFSFSILHPRNAPSIS